MLSNVKKYTRYGGRSSTLTWPLWSRLAGRWLRPLKREVYYLLGAALCTAAWFKLDRGLLIVAAVAAAIWLLWRVPHYGTNGFGQRNEARKTLAQILGGLGVLFGVYATLETLNLNRRAAEKTELSQIDERISNAVSHLNDQGTVTQLNSVYTLGNIAATSERHRAQCLSVLCSYIRSESRKRNAREFPVPLQKALDVVGSGTFTGMQIDLRDADLSGADLRGSALANANLNGANLESADLAGANLSSAQLAAAKLASAFLLFTDLRGATLADADMANAELHYTQLYPSALDRAKGLDMQQRARAGGFRKQPAFGFIDFPEDAIVQVGTPKKGTVMGWASPSPPRLGGDGAKIKGIVVYVNGKQASQMIVPSLVRYDVSGALPGVAEARESGWATEIDLEKGANSICATAVLQDGKGSVVVLPHSRRPGAFMDTTPLKCP